MKTPHALLAAFSAILLAACDKPATETTKPDSSPEELVRKQADIPLLPLRKGDFWKYAVRVEIPSGVTSPGAAEVDLDHERTRTYLGKVHVAAGLPPTDAFDVTTSGHPTERELVEIHDDRILMRGSARPEMPDGKPMWLDPPVPFVLAGMRPGQEMPTLNIEDGTRSRGMKIVARENVTVPAGEFQAIRLLMTGQDGKIESRRTTWFAPGIGIVKEEKTRYANEKLLLRETHELTATSVTLSREKTD